MTDEEKFGLLQAQWPEIAASILDLWKGREDNPEFVKDLMHEVRDMICGDAGWGSTMEPTKKISVETQKALEEHTRRCMLTEHFNTGTGVWFLTELAVAFVDAGLLVEPERKIRA